MKIKEISVLRIKAIATDTKVVTSSYIHRTCGNFVKPQCVRSDVRRHRQWETASKRFVSQRLTPFKLLVRANCQIAPTNRSRDQNLLYVSKLVLPTQTETGTE